LIAPRPVATVVDRVSAETPKDAAEAERILVRPGSPLATVNDAPITLADLVALGPEESAARAFGVDHYRFLLRRAIERELVLQAAEARGILLTETQRRALGAVYARARALEADVFDDLGRPGAAAADLEARDLAARMLLAVLAEQAGAPAHVTPEAVERHYREHAAEHDALPADPAARRAAWREIDRRIRRELVSQVDDAHAAARLRVVAELEAAARVVVLLDPPQRMAFK
jgi:hypothetical protein